MRNKFSASIFLIAACLLAPFSARATVIFQDNFDDNCTGQACNVTGCATYAPGTWDQWYCETMTPDTYGGVFHYAGEISGPGRGGTGKDYKFWRAGAAYPYTYSGSLVKVMNFGSAIYMRYYAKWPATWNNDGISGNDAQSHKLFRFMTSGGTNEFNIDIIDINGSFQNGAVIAIDDFTDRAGQIPGRQWTQLLSNSDFTALIDGQWHAWQWRFDIPNHALQLWIDGVQKYSDTNWIWGCTGSFTLLNHWPEGNTSGNYQDSWNANEYDDLVIATTKAETDPDGSSDTTPPTAPGGLSVF